VAMLPWCAFGHMIPFFQLSLALARTGVKVSFIASPRNIQRLPKIPEDLTKLVGFVVFSLPNLEDKQLLPEGAEASVDIPAEKIQYLKVAYDLLQQPLKQFVAQQNPDCIIIDMIPHWMAEIAQENRVPLLHFSVFSASTYVFLGNPECLVGEGKERLRPIWKSMTKTPEWVDFPSSLAYSDHEAIGVHEWLYAGKASGISDAERTAKILTSSQALAIRSRREIEGEYLDVLERITGKPVVPVGLLPPEKPQRREIITTGGSGPWSETFKWLDEQSPKSVVFVSFGSEYKLSREQIYEIADGVELSGLPFLKPSWANHDLEALPFGFEERTSGRGLVCTGWAPQMELLAHKSIGGSLFHSGWGSVIESLQFGHSLVLLPFIIDQPLNARLLVEKGLAVEVERGEDGSFSKDGIAKALRLAMVSQEGNELKKRAGEAAWVFGNKKNQENYTNRFVEFLKNNKSAKIRLDLNNHISIIFQLFRYIFGLFNLYSCISISNCVPTVLLREDFMVDMANDLHVAVLPWSAFGHIMPFFQFSIALARAGVHVSFLSTPKILERLPKLSPALSQLINLVELPLPALDEKYGLPEGAEATVDIQGEKIQYLKIAYDLLQHPFRQFVSEKSPDWIVIDFSSHWAVDIAKEHHIPVVYLSVFNAATRAFGGTPEYLAGDGQKRLKGSPESLTSPPEWITFPSSIAFRIHEARNYHPGFYGDNASGIRDSDRVAKVMEGCQVVAIRSCVEFEGKYLELFQNMLGKPVIPIGLLPPEKPDSRDITTSDEKWCKVFEWLDNQEPRSVLFVGFGSECKLTKDQVYEIAYGLELSELPFLWVLREPTWATEEVEPLPPGFRSRTSEKGIVCIGWAPQLEILAHPSIGGSLFHSGWGSVIETLQHGHCLVVLPFIIDQPLNARLLVEKGLAVEVDRQEDGSFSRSDIAKSVRFAMVSEEGKQLRTRAKGVAMVFGFRKLHRDYINSFVDYLKSAAWKDKPTTGSDFKG
ncbi:hypothetical protein Tsubulata_031416, partial [Turnera subulata]